MRCPTPPELPSRSGEPSSIDNPDLNRTSINRLYKLSKIISIYIIVFTTEVLLFHFYFLLVQYWWNRWGLQFLSRFVTFSRLCFPYLFLVMIWRADLKFLCIFMRCSSPIYTIFKRETEIKLARRILNYNVYECTLS